MKYEYKVEIWATPRNGYLIPDKIRINGEELKPEDFQKAYNLGIFINSAGTELQRKHEPPTWLNREPNHKQPASANRPGYVYLMLDKNTGLYKIGFSADPNKRERTLQSEKPIIEMVRKWEGTMWVEKQLHEKFAKKRVRGEWFRLTAVDVAYIQTL